MKKLPASRDRHQKRWFDCWELREEPPECVEDDGGFHVPGSKQDDAATPFALPDGEGAEVGILGDDDTVGQPSVLENFRVALPTEVRFRRRFDVDAELAQRGRDLDRHVLVEEEREGRVQASLPEAASTTSSLTL
ncbi:MAG TPA: hypothetical protein VFS60_09515 [Thermoanaerobaculia bacterium]|nr:hypothetical protein [Thermoanaerobaculia bacterium]